MSKALPIRLYDGSFFELEDKYIAYDKTCPVNYNGYTVYPTSLNWAAFSANIDDNLFSTNRLDDAFIVQYRNLIDVRQKAKETLFYQCGMNLLPYPQLTKDEFIQLFYDKCWDTTKYLSDMIDLCFRDYLLETDHQKTYLKYIKVCMGIMCFGLARKDVKALSNATSVELDNRFMFASTAAHKTKEDYPYHLLYTELSGLYKDMAKWVEKNNLIYDLRPIYQNFDIKSFLQPAGL